MADNMPTAIRITLVATALFTLICLAGCGTKRTAYGVSASNVSWMTSTSNPVAGVDHDFSKGTLFLISTQRDPPAVAQIKTDLSELLEGKSSAGSALTRVLKVDAVKGLVKSNPQVRDFFVKHKKADEDSK